MMCIMKLYKHFTGQRINCYDYFIFIKLQALKYHIILINTNKQCFGLCGTDRFSQSSTHLLPQVSFPSPTEFYSCSTCCRLAHLMVLIMLGPVPAIQNLWICLKSDFLICLKETDLQKCIRLANATGNWEMCFTDELFRKNNKITDSLLQPTT